ncbi:MAG: hypothetical protein R3B69_00340 [Candidatus Paceibacterota bacterium]
METPTLGDPFDNEKVATTQPTFDFVSADPQNDDLEYEISWSTDNTFTVSSTTRNSNASAGFANSNNGGDTNPFTSGDTITYTVQAGDALTNGETYWWRVRARDPGGDNAWSPWALADSFTVDTSVTVSTWYQTTAEQFVEGELTGLTASTSGSVEIAGTIGEYGTATLTDNNWTTINTDNEYIDMVVVASPEFNAATYNTNRNTRVRNKTAGSFEIKVDNYNQNITGSTVVDYIVMEAGTWTLDDGGAGTQVIAGTYADVDEVQSNNYTPGIGVVVPFSPSFSSPPVPILTVSSDNDTSWVGTHVDGNGADHDVEVGTDEMQIALARSLATGVHDPEDIDYVVFGVADGTINGAAFEAFNSSDSVDDTQSNGGHAQSFQTGFATTPGVTLVQNNAEDGGNGGFAIKDTSGTSNASQIFLSILEDGPSPDQHTQEVVSIVAFEANSGNLTRAGAESFVGSIVSEDIIFSDGAGPKFESFSWSDNEPGASEILYQVEYKVDDTTYALVPDGVIPGNSSGTTTSPIDLTGIDIETYPIIRIAANFSCVSGDCPTLDDWQVTWSEGVNMSGTLQAYDRSTNIATGTIRVAVNGSLLPSTGTVAAGLWTLSNVTAFAGDVVTVWVDGVADSEEAVTVFVYDGVGDMTGVSLYQRHLTNLAGDKETITNTLFGSYDNSVSGDEDIFFDVDGFNNLTVCATGSCEDANLYIGAGHTYITATSTPTSVTTHDFVNEGTVLLDANTYYVSGSWLNYATSTTDTSTLVMTASTTDELIVSTESPLNFHHLTLGAGSGTSTYSLTAPLDLSGNLSVVSGMFDRASYDIHVAGNINTDAQGIWVGYATTTFDGTVAATWNDNHASTSLQNIGNVLIDGTSKSVSITSNVLAYDITIGSNDTLIGGNGNHVNVAGDWTNDGNFTANTSQVVIVNDDRVYPDPVPGTAGWYADTNFTERIAVVVDDSEVPGDLTNYPLYIDLSGLGTTFWSAVQSDGSDIRVTAGDGQTELPIDLVEIDQTAQTGELHTLATSISSSATTTFYVYFGNATATTYAVSDTYGAQNVWADYEAVYHFHDDPAVLITDETGRGRNLLPAVGTAATTTGLIGTALDTTASNVMLQSSSWTWPAGYNLISSGLYFQSAIDNGALWQFGDGSGSNNGTYLSFMPWYSNGTRGYHYFGVTSGGDYAFTRDNSIWHHFTTIGRAASGESNQIYEDNILRVIPHRCKLTILPPVHCR